MDLLSLDRLINWKLLIDICKKDSQEIVEECTFEVEPKFMKLFKRVHKQKLEQIERESHLEIVWAENEARVKIKPTPLTEETRYQEGCNAFIDLYQTAHQSMKRQVVDIEDIHDDEKIKEVIAFVESKHPVVIEVSWSFTARKFIERAQ